MMNKPIEKQMENPILFTMPKGVKAPALHNPISKERKAFEKLYGKTQRNDLCPCGSEVKFKKCCLLTKPQ